MQPFGGSFGEAVGDGLEHDGVVVVMRSLVRGDARLQAPAGAHGEGADPVRHARVRIGDEIAEAVVGFAGRALVLLAGRQRGDKGVRLEYSKRLGRIGSSQPISRNAVCNCSSGMALMPSPSG